MLACTYGGCSEVFDCGNSDIGALLFENTDK